MHHTRSFMRSPRLTPPPRHAACFENTVQALYKYVVPKPKAECTKEEQLGVSFAAGYIAGVFCAVVSHPADNLVSKMNSQKGAAMGDIIKEMGWVALFTRGLPLRIVMIGTLTGLQWGLYDAFKVAVGLCAPLCPPFCWHAVCPLRPSRLAACGAGVEHRGWLRAGHRLLQRMVASCMWRVWRSGHLVGRDLRLLCTRTHKLCSPKFRAQLRGMVVYARLHALVCFLHVVNVM
jgi:hypothetical protein